MIIINLTEEWTIWISTKKNLIDLDKIVDGIILTRIEITGHFYDKLW